MAATEKTIIAGIAIVVVLAIIAVIGAACCACVLFASNNSWHWGEWDGYSTPTDHEVRTTTHAAAENVELYVDTLGGNVEIVQSATATDITVTYDVKAPAGRLDNMLTSTKSVRVDDNTTRITAEAKLKSGILAGNYGADVTITVPKNASYYLNLHTLGGDITVPPLHGSAAYLDTLGGKLRLSNGKFETIYMSTAGGDIVASYEASNVTLKTLGGNIQIDTTQTAGSLYTNTLGGNIQIDTLQTAGTIYANTMGGNVDVRLPSGTLFTVDASTFGGEIRHHSVPMSPTTDNERSLKGPTEGGAGDLKVTLKTMGGNIDISY